MTTHVRAAGVLVALGMACGLAHGATWYVDNQAGGSGNGLNWGDAFTSLGTAVSTVWGSGANSGDTISVRQANGAPNYTENIILGAGYSDGTPGSFNRIAGWTGAGYEPRPAINKGALNANVLSVGATDNSVARNYYEFSDLKLVGAHAWNDRAIDLYSTSSHIRFTDNECLNADFYAIGGGTTADNTDLLVQGNTMPAGSGISLRGDTNVQILDNSFGGSGGSGAAITMAISGSDITIRDNVFDVGGGDGISAQSYGNVTVDGNRFTTSYRGTIYQDSQWVTNWEVYNNIFDDCRFTSGGAVGLLRFSADDVNIYNNTFHNLLTDNLSYIYLAATSTGNVIFNNIFSEGGTGSTAVIGAAGSGATVGYNDFWNVTTDYSGVTSSGGDLYLDPSFNDPGAGDFWPWDTTVARSATALFAGVSAPGDDYHDEERLLVGISLGAVQIPEPATMGLLGLGGFGLLIRRKR